MTTTRTATANTPGDGRYRLPTDPSRPSGGTLARAHDTRLGREGLLRWNDDAARAEDVAARLSGFDHPGVARVLDAGADPGTHGSFSVFAFLDWPTLADAPPSGRPADIAAAAAWLVAAYATAQARCGEALGVRAHDVLVDPRAVTGDLPAGECAVRWMPGPARGGDDLATVVAGLGDRAGRRARRRFGIAVDLLALPHGRRRAVTVLAGIAGLDPLLLGLSPAASHQVAAVA